MARIYRVILPVTDIEQAARFYCDLFGQLGQRVSGGRHYFNCGGVILACFDPQADGDGFDAKPNPDHIYFAVPDIDAAFERARRLNCQEIESKVAVRPWGERSFYFKDPFGNPICIVDERTIFTGQQMVWSNQFPPFATATVPQGNDRVMTRGTFANIRLKNLLAPGTEGGVTRCLLPGQDTSAVVSIYDASMKYKNAGVPLVVLAGAEYGTGSSRDWAAKGTFLLGVRAVIAVSYERIHRSNLVGMGVLPLEFKKGQSREALGLDGTEVYDIDLPSDVKPLADVTVTATKADGKKITFSTTCRIDTPVEVDYYRHGGILHYVLRQLAQQ